MRAGPLTAAILGCAALIAPACGGSDDDADVAANTTLSTTATAHPEPEPPDAAHEHAEEDEDGPAGEASPEAAAAGPETGELSEVDSAAVAAVVSSYVDALNNRDAGAACGFFAPGALQLSELPKRRGGCVGSVGASLGSRPAAGGPAWRRTRIVEVTAVSVEGVGARVTATVVHRFRDRQEPSIEEDVIYLRPKGGRWLLAKPSATFYRAVGYADPPLRALTPP